MGKIVFFEEDPKVKGVLRFVSGYQSAKWWRREKIKYSYHALDGSMFEYKEEEHDLICNRIKSDYPNALVYLLDYDEFLEQFSNNRFFAICKWNEKDNEFYQGDGLDRKALYSTDIADARMMFAESSANQTLRTIQQTTRDKVYLRTLYLNFENGLFSPCLMITCTSKGSGQTKYFAREEGKRLRLVTTSNAATKFNYESAVQMWEYLKTRNKNFLYAVLPVFKDNVNCKNIEQYMRENKVSRMVVMDLQLKHLNR